MRLDPWARYSTGPISDWKKHENKPHQLTETVTEREKNRDVKCKP